MKALMWIKQYYYEYRHRGDSKSPLQIVATIKTFGFHKDEKNMKRYKKRFPHIVWELHFKGDR